jgi:hypothetical protein
MVCLDDKKLKGKKVGEMKVWVESERKVRWLFVYYINEKWY